MLFPRHRYLGPGNPVPNGPPVDADDRIALLHDIRYNRAHSDQDIRTADLEAVSNFSIDFRRDYNWHSFIGAVGLGVKYITESVTGVLYPGSYRPVQRPDRPLDQFKSIVQQQGAGQQPAVMDTMQGDEPSQKKQKLEEGRSGAGGEHAALQVQRPISNFKTGKIVFRHSRIMYSFGYQFKCITASEKTEASTLQYLVSTPFARVPCQALPWYMTQTEFNNLPMGSSGRIFSTVVTPLGYRTPFVTNSAGINSVNSNLLVHVVHAHGLNNKFHGTNMTLASSASDPMIVTSVSVPKDDGCNITDMWGASQTANDSSIDFSSIPACFGNKKPFRTYYLQNVDKGTGLVTLPDIMQDLNIFTLTNGAANEPIMWEYRPQVCVLKVSEPYPFFRNYSSEKVTSILYGTKVDFAKLASIKISGLDHSTATMASTKNLIKSSLDIPYTTQIEQCGSIMHGLNEYAGGLQPPTLHVGVLPVNAYSTDPQDSKVQEVLALWKCDTYCEIEYSYDFTHPYLTYVHPVMKVMGTADPVNSAGNCPHRDFAYGYRSSLNYDK